MIWSYEKFEKQNVKFEKNYTLKNSYLFNNN
jgi:hypothetical protein